eukprot:14469913-Alexandrium_andersonii.AAC.1
MVDQAQGVPGLQRSNRATVGHFGITTQGGATRGGPQPTVSSARKRFNDGDNGSRKGCGRERTNCNLSLIHISEPTRLALI